MITGNVNHRLTDSLVEVLLAGQLTKKDQVKQHQQRLADALDKEHEETLTWQQAAELSSTIDLLQSQVNEVDEYLSQPVSRGGLQ